VPNCKSLLVTEAERNISGEARDLKNMETLSVINLFFLQCKTLKENHVTLRER